MTLEELVGQKLVLGIDGARAAPETVDLFRKTRAGGLILFKRNLPSADSVRRLISDLESALGRRLLILLDHEGGRVIHAGDGVTVFPDAQAAGVNGGTDLVRRQGEVEAKELRRLGVDMNLAPVLDVLAKSWNPAIGTRSYGFDPQLVAEMGKARIQGMQSKGLSACAKHYPGLGEAPFDPHRDLPVIGKNWKAMKQWDLIPFVKAIEAGVDAVMSSHPVYPELDPRPSLPATFSRRIIHDSLRLEFGFPGVILTDDLKMGAITQSVPFREAVPLAAEAGHDFLLVCSDPRSQLEAFDALLWSYKKKDLKLRELEESHERIFKLKEKRRTKFEGEPAAEKEGNQIAGEMARTGAAILRNPNGLLPLSPAWCFNHPVGTFFPGLGPVAEKWFLEPELLRPEKLLRPSFSQFGVQLKSVDLVSLQPDERERMKIKQKAEEQDLTFFFLWDAHLFSGARELLGDLQKTAKRLVVVLLREPQDVEWILAGTACLTAYGFRLPQVEAAIEKAFSG